MDALLAAFGPVIAIINRQIAESTPAGELCERLDGRTIAVRVRNTGLTATVTVNENQLDLTSLDVAEPDAAICGSLLALAQLAGENGEALIRDGRVELSGDATVAGDFRDLLRFARPDMEESLAGIVGDAAAQGIGNALRSAGRWGREARKTFRQNIGEYLQEESRKVPTRYEYEEFCDDVQVLRDDVERIEARLNRLEAEIREQAE